MASRQSVMLALLGLIIGGFGILGMFTSTADLILTFWNHAELSAEYDRGEAAPLAMIGVLFAIHIKAALVALFSIQAAVGFGLYHITIGE